jgi:predicted nucleic acid-binding protein
LKGGVYRHPAQATVRLRRLDAILKAIPALAFDDASADAYDAMLASIGYSRRRLLDRLIASQAIVHRATLVTLNPQDFSDIPRLKLLAWS